MLTTKGAEFERHMAGIHRAMADDYVRIRAGIRAGGIRRIHSHSTLPLVDIILGYRGIDTRVIWTAAQTYHAMDENMVHYAMYDAISNFYAVRGIRGAAAYESLYDYALRHGLADNLRQAYAAGFSMYGGVSRMDIGAYYAEAAALGRADVVGAIAAAPRSTIIQYHGVSGLIRSVVNRPMDEKKAIAAIRTAAEHSGLPGRLGTKFDTHQQYIIAAAFREPFGSARTDQLRHHHLFTLIHCHDAADDRVIAAIADGMIGDYGPIRCLNCRAAHQI